MKKVIFAVLLLVSISSFASGHLSNFIYYAKSAGGGKHISASQVPGAVLNSFHKMFPSAINAEWELENEHGSNVYQARFTVKGKDNRVQFLANGAVAGGGGGNGGHGSDDGPGHQ